MTTISGIYNKTIYRNRKTGYTSFLVNLSSYDDAGRKMYVCKGNIPSYVPGSPLTLSGELKKDKDDVYFDVHSSDYNISEKSLLISFITSNLPVGMGIKKAEQINSLLTKLNQTIEEFASLDNAIDHLCTVDGFTRSKAVQFLNKIESSLVEKDLFYQLARFGITYPQVSKLYKAYGNQVKEILKKDPYLALSGIGISFSKIDAYAKETGYDYCDSNRIRSLTSLTAKNLSAFGHTFADNEMFYSLFRQTERLVSAFDEQIPKSLVYLEICQNRDLYVENNKISNKDARNTEIQIVSHLKRLRDSKIPLISHEKIEEYKKADSVCDDTQKTTFDLLSETDTCFLIGGPGTGKTTTIKEVINIFKEQCPSKTFALCAPTGRAAQRIKESSGEEASTIHLLLEYYFDGDEARPFRNAENPLDADFVIVDEFSMVGIYLFKNLLSALKDGTKLLLVGDWNQLQSVEPGALLHDMVDSGKFRTVTLSKIHRQAEGNVIIENSKKILNGDISLESNDDYKIIRCLNNEEGRLKLKEIFLKEFDKDNIDDCLVMAPGRKGEYGIEGLNALIQSELHTTSEPYVTCGNRLYFEDERIMTTRNKYDLPNYYNGDLWKLKSVVDESHIILEDKDGFFIDLQDDLLDDIELAYAITVHKCQGSEARTCILFLPDDVSKRLISKSLLYTAATRPQERFVIITVNDMLEKFINAPISGDRNSNIKDLLAQNM